MVTTPCPHCNQRIEFDATMPGTYECPYCGKQFRLGKRTKPNPISNTTKPKKVVQQAKRSVGENIVLGLSLSIGTIFAMISILILFYGLSGDRFILFFLPLTFFIGPYFLLYSYKITSKSSDNQTATLLIGGKETTIQLQSNNNQALDGALKGLKLGMIVTLVLTVIGLVMAVIAILTLMGLFFAALGGGGW
jgi:hypothetical protein